MGGAYLAATLERGNAIDGLRKLEEEAPFGKYAKAAEAEWAEWAERAHGGLRDEAGRGCSGLGRNRRKKLFPNKI
jgi:hypothetical protein